MSEPPVAGTQEWLDWVVYPVVGKDAFARFGPGYLLGTRKGWEFLCDFSKYAYFRDGRGLTMKMLDKALKPNTRSKNEPAAFGDVSETSVCERVSEEGTDI